jgi:hypothetical protein
VTICEHIDGTKEVMAGDKLLEFKVLNDEPTGPVVLDTKEIEPFLNQLALLASKKSSSQNRVPHKGPLGRTAHLRSQGELSCPPCGLVDNAPTVRLQTGHF